MKAVYLGSLVSEVGSMAIGLVVENLERETCFLCGQVLKPNELFGAVRIANLSLVGRHVRCEAGGESVSGQPHART